MNVAVIILCNFVNLGFSLKLVLLYLATILDDIHWVFIHILQVIVAILSLSLNLTRDCKLYDESQKNWAEGINYFSLGCVFVISFLNVLLVGLDPYAVV